MDAAPNRLACGVGSVHGIPPTARRGGAVSGALRIVLVEDDAIIALDLSELLVAMGHQVCAIASSEEEAVEAAARFRPDLMIVDGGLVEGSGVMAMRRILAQGPVAHVYVTGSPRAVLAQVPGAIILAKPFSVLELERGIAQARSAVRPRP